MKKALTVFVAMALTATLATSAFAQQAGPAKSGEGKPGKAGQAGKGGKGDGRMMMGLMRDGKEVFAKLNLSADQSKALKSLQEKTMKEMRIVREKAGEDRKAMREPMMKLGKQFQEGLKGILSPNQEAKLQELMKARMEEYRKSGGPGGDRKKGSGIPPVK